MSAVSIKDTIYLKFKIEDTELDAHSFNFDSVSVIEAISQVAPTMSLKVYDTGGFFSRTKSLVEGTKFTIEIGKDVKNAYIGEFRLFGMRNYESSYSGQLWELTFLFNVPKFTTQSCCEVYSGSPITSAAAMRSLAGKGGLGYEGLSSTNDKQKWLNIAQTRASMSEYIAEHGYISDTSCTVVAVTGTKKLLYKDIIEESTSKPKADFMHNTDKKDAKATPYLVREAKSATSSGIFNSWVNYGYQTNNHSLSGDNIVTEKMPATKTGPYLPINSDVKSDVENKSRVDYARYLDCGSDSPNQEENNVHLNFVKAYYQNLRYKAMFSEKVYVLTEDKTDLQVLDCVEYTQNDLVRSDFKINSRTSGKYIISAKTIHCKAGLNYYEKFELIRSHITEAGLTNLV